jgi:hypothetical protein
MTAQTKKQVFIKRADGSFLTPEFRVSFPYVFEKDKKGKYGVAMVFPKDTVDMSELSDAVEELRQQEFAKPPKGHRAMWPVHDGDEGTRKEYEGSFYINGKCGKYRPGVVGPDKQEIENAEDFYPGCWAQACVTLYAWTSKENGTYGISVNVRNLMKKRDDEPLVGRVVAEDDFEGVDSPADDL